MIEFFIYNFLNATQSQKICCSCNYLIKFLGNDDDLLKIMIKYLINPKRQWLNNYM